MAGNPSDTRGMNVQFVHAQSILKKGEKTMDSDYYYDNPH